MNLSSIRTPSGKFTIAAFDHRGSLAKLFNLEPDSVEAKALLPHLKTLFMEAFSSMASAILVDPEYGFPAIDHKAPNVGLIMSLESSGYGDDHQAMPVMIQNWSVRHVKNNYAVAKLLLYYHPLERNAEQKRKLIMELYQYCQYEEIAFLIEPVIYNPLGKEELPLAEFQELQLKMAQDFQRYCDVIKLQYPGDALASATLTAELDIPWIVLSRGMPYQKFKEALKISTENGAQGFAAGRSIWQEIGEMRTTDGKPDLKAIQEFLFTTGKTRMQELIDLTV